MSSTWPRTFITAFHFAGDASENEAFASVRADYAKKASGWSHFVVTPENAEDCISKLPPGHRDAVLSAFHDGLTKWVERAELAKFSALYWLGGITHDALDCELLDIDKLERFRSTSPLLVVGNAIDCNGASFESDILASSSQSDLVLKLVCEIARRVLCRTKSARSNSAHFTVQGAYCAWAAENAFAGHNIVLRSMEGTLRCKPAEADCAFKVVHQVTWRTAGSPMCPAAWKSLPVFTDCLYNAGSKRIKKRSCLAAAPAMAMAFQSCFGKRARMSDSEITLDVVLASPGAYPHKQAPECVAKYLKAAAKGKQPAAMPDREKRAAAVALIVSNHDALLEDWGLKRMATTARSHLWVAKGSWENLSPFFDGAGRGGAH